MSTLAVIKDVRERLADPRRWVQGTYAGLRTPNGVIPFWQHRLTGHQANCWCLSTAITLAVCKVLPDANDPSWTELRSDVERELLVTLDAGDRWPAVYLFNDSLATSHADVIDLLDRTTARLEAAA